MHTRSALKAVALGVVGATLAFGPSAGPALADSSSDGRAVEADDANRKKRTVVAVAKSSGDFSTLVDALDAAGLVKALKAKGPFTVFAPTNAAFEAVPPADLEALLADEAALAEVLKYHVVEGRIRAKDLEPTQTVPTLQGGELTITVSPDGSASITDASGDVVNITATDLKAKNGVVHVIDGVLTPAS
jgi:uncharacterized surface protein with fasciclin (FAS1) repeats